MANIQSQIKRNRQNEGRRRRNQSVRTALRNRMKRFAAAADAGDRETAVATYRDAARKLDKAASKGVVHANYAANHKSQMAHRLESLPEG